MSKKMKKELRSLTEAEWKALQSEVVQRYMDIEVTRVAMRFNLNDADRAELQCMMFEKVALRVSKNYDASKRNMYSFVQMVLPDLLRNWMRDEYQHGLTFVPMTDEIARENAEREDLGAAERVRGEEGFGGMSLERCLTITAVRCVLARLSPESRRVCKLYMKMNSLTKVAAYLKQDSQTFFYVTWPRVKKEFLSLWEKSQSGHPSRVE